MVLDFYCIALKRNFNHDLKYGLHRYDFNEGVLYSMPRGQFFGMAKRSKEQSNEVSGWMLLIHPLTSYGALL